MSCFSQISKSRIYIFFLIVLISCFRDLGYWSCNPESKLESNSHGSRRAQSGDEEWWSSLLQQRGEKQTTSKQLATGGRRGGEFPKAAVSFPAGPGFLFTYSCCVVRPTVSVRLLSSPSLESADVNSCCVWMDRQTLFWASVWCWVGNRLHQGLWSGLSCCVTAQLLCPAGWWLPSEGCCAVWDGTFLNKLHSGMCYVACLRAQLNSRSLSWLINN